MRRVMCVLMLVMFCGIAFGNDCGMFGNDVLTDLGNHLGNDWCDNFGSMCW